MQHWLSHVALFSWRSPLRLLLLIALPTFFLGGLGLHISVDASILGALNDEDPDVIQLRELQEVFPQGGTLVLLIKKGSEEKRQTAALQAEELFEELDVVESARARWEPAELLERTIWSIEPVLMKRLLLLVEKGISPLMEQPDRGLGEINRFLLTPSPFRNPIVDAQLVADQLSFLSGNWMSSGAKGLPLKDGWYAATEGDLYLVELQTQLNPIGGAIDPIGYLSIEQACSELQAQFPELAIELGGMAAVSYQDSSSVIKQILPLSTISFLLVLWLLWRLSRSFWAVVAVAGALVTSLIWTSGFVSLSIGYLSFLAAGFGVILFGLGIDFAAHILLRFDHERRAGAAEEEAISLAWGRTGRGVVVGGVTTAAAFGLISLIEFKAAVHLGIASALAIFAALVAMFTVLPALLKLVDQHRQIPPPPQSARRISVLAQQSLAHRGWVVGFFFCVIAVTVWRIPSIELERDLREVMTQDLPALNAADEVKRRLDITLEPVSIMLEEQIP